jgi:hypothetical protein
VTAPDSGAFSIAWVPAVRPPIQSCASACAAGVPNGQPKLLLNLFLPGYPLVNFAVCTAVYVFVSYRLFFLTNALKNVAIPGKEMGLLWRNGAIMAAAAAVSILCMCCNTSRCESQLNNHVVQVLWM